MKEQNRYHIFLNCYSCRRHEELKTDELSVGRGIKVGCNQCYRYLSLKLLPKYQGVATTWSMFMHVLIRVL